VLRLDRSLEFEADPETYWLYRPQQEGFVWLGGNTFRSPPVRINNLGLRGRDIDLADHRRRILTLGDSLTFGSGVRDDETFSAVLERELGPEQVQVMNAGVPGYGLFQEAALLRRLGPLLRPEVVIVTIPTGDIWRQPLASQEAARQLLSVRKKRLRRLLQFPTLLYRQLSYAYTRLMARGGPPTERTRYIADFAKHWEADAARLKTMAEECRAIGATLVIMLWLVVLLKSVSPF
jgi:lysophospholipase L1-like esterase